VRKKTFSGGASALEPPSGPKYITVGSVILTLIRN
jgi:hypothetical protein